MSLREVLRRVGAASPLVPALGYGACILVANLIITIDAESVLFALPGLLLYIVATLALFVIVTWFRDDDWLAAGFLFGLTLLLGNWIAAILLGVLATGSIGGAVFSGAGMLFGLMFRALLLVPVSGGIITLARVISRKLRAGAAHRPETGSA